MPSPITNSTEWDRSARRALATATRRAAKSKPPPAPPKRPWISIIRLQHLLNEAEAQTLTEPNQEFSDEVKQELQDEWWLIVEDSVNVFWERMRCESCGGVCGTVNFNMKGGNREERFESWLEGLRGKMDVVEAWEVKEEWVEKWNEKLVAVERGIAESRAEGCVTHLENVEEPRVEVQLREGAVDGRSVVEEQIMEESIIEEPVMDENYEFRLFAVVGSPVHSEVESSIYEEEKDELVVDEDAASGAGSEKLKATKAVEGSEILETERPESSQNDVVGQFTSDELDGVEIIEAPTTAGSETGGEIDEYDTVVGQFTIDELDEDGSTEVHMAEIHERTASVEETQAPAPNKGKESLMEGSDADQVNEVDGDSVFYEVNETMAEGSVGAIDSLFGDIGEILDSGKEASIDSFFEDNDESMEDRDKLWEDYGPVHADDASAESSQSEEE